jgi:Domain of unknown function (DUF397)
MGHTVDTITWRKSSHSGSNGGACVEVAGAWRKSTYSGGNGGGCVEVAGNLPGVVAVRDSKDPGGPVLAFSPDAWRAFTAAIKAGELDPA